MLKYLKNNFVISAVIFLSVLLITILYALEGLIPTFLSFLINFLIIFSTIFIVILCESLFLFSIDSLILRVKKFKERFFYVMKSLWLSRFVILPTILILFFVNLFINLEFVLINKIITFAIVYLSQLTLFFSYKFITGNNWHTTIKVVASQSILSVLLLLLKFI